MNVNDDLSAYRRRPADVLAAVEIVLRDLGLDRLYLRACRRVGVLSVAPGPDLDYAMVVKEFRSQPKPEATKYSPTAIKSVTIKKVSGSPDPGTSPRPTWSARTSRSAWACAGSPA
jgi:hypothetical protein